MSFVFFVVQNIDHVRISPRQGPIPLRDAVALAEVEASAVHSLHAALSWLDDGQLDAAFNDAGLDRVAGETSDLVDIELPHEMVAVLLDRLNTDAQGRRNLLVGLTLGNQLEHLPFARTQTDGVRLGPTLSVQRIL